MHVDDRPFDADNHYYEPARRVHAAHSAGVARPHVESRRSGDVSATSSAAGSITR